MLGALGNESDRAISGARALAACFGALGVAEASFAGSVEVADGQGGQVVAQTECGRLLFVRTDGEIALSEEALDVLREALTPAEERIPFESGIRQSGVVSREEFDLACVRDLDVVRARKLKIG